MRTKGFNLIVTNHGDLRAIEDWILTIMGMLRVVGSDVALGDRFATDRINVVLEGFDVSFLAEIESAAKRGSKIIIIATEYVTGNTFNQFKALTPFERALLPVIKIKPARSIIKRVFHRRWRQHFDRTLEFTGRFRTFVRAAEVAQCIWVAEPNEVPAYTQLLGSGKRVVGFPYCWFESSEYGINGWHTLGDKTCDVFFSGALTDYRLSLLGELEAKGFSVTKLPPTTPLFLRNHFADRARVVLDLKKNPDWGYISSLRVHYHLQRGDLVVCEKRKHACSLQPYVLLAKDSIVSLIPGLLQKGDDLVRLGRDNLQRFQDERPALRLVPELLERSGL